MPFVEGSSELDPSHRGDTSAPTLVCEANVMGYRTLLGPAHHSVLCLKIMGWGTDGRANQVGQSRAYKRRNDSSHRCLCRSIRYCMPNTIYSPISLATGHRSRKTTRRSCTSCQKVASGLSKQGTSRPACPLLRAEPRAAACRHIERAMMVIKQELETSSRSHSDLAVLLKQQDLQLAEFLQKREASRKAVSHDWSIAQSKHY